MCTRHIAKQIARLARDHQPRRAPRASARVSLPPAYKYPSPSSSLPSHLCHSTMSRALALVVLLLAAAAVAPLASAHGVGVEESVMAAKEEKSARAVGADPDPSPASGLPADPAPDARP